MVWDKNSPAIVVLSQFDDEVCTVYTTIEIESNYPYFPFLFYSSILFLFSQLLNHSYLLWIIHAVVTRSL